MNRENQTVIALDYINLFYYIQLKGRGRGGVMEGGGRERRRVMVVGVGGVMDGWVGESDGGRGSNGGKLSDGGRREWCGVVEEGEPWSSLTWACHCPCPLNGAGCGSRTFISIGDHLHLWVSIFTCGWSSLLVGDSCGVMAINEIRGWVVVIRGTQYSWVGVIIVNGGHCCPWALKVCGVVHGHSRFVVLSVGA